MNSAMDRAVRLWPILVFGACAYLGVMIWAWSSSWFGAEDMTARLAVGDSARKVLTFLQAALAFIGTGSWAWFLLAPMRNWQHGVWAASPYVFTWAVISAFGANTAFTGGTDFKYCSIDPDTLQISGNYDLSPAERKRSPPYYDPKNGRQLIPCAEAERRREDGLKIHGKTANGNKAKSAKAAPVTGDTAVPNGSSPVTISVPASRKAPIYIEPGDRAGIPREATIFLRGPMQATIVNTADRITAWSGTFKLNHEGTDDATWTAGFSQTNPTLGVSGWLYRVRQAAANGQHASRVVITIESGTVFLGTCAVAHECAPSR